MDQTVIMNYALGYIASGILIFLLLLPLVLTFVLLLFLAAVIQLGALSLKAIAVGAYRSVGLLFRSPSGRLPRGRGGGGLVPH